MLPMTPDEQATLTPMMRQYHELKEQAPDAVLLFRMGDFFEIFGDDALEVAPKLELMLTSREKSKDQDRVPFCGVPHHSAKSYWLKLLKMGYKVAIADQVEDPKLAKGIVKREIVRVLTPGCIDELEGLESDEPNYLMGVYEHPQHKIWAVVVVDISTGEMRCGNAGSLDELVSLIEKFKPSEVAVRRFFRQDLVEALTSYLGQHHLVFADLSEGTLRDSARQQQILTEVFSCTALDEQLCGKVMGGEELVAAILDYLMGLKATCSQFLSIRPLIEIDAMILDEVAVRDLELFETVRRRSREGSLFFEINRTLTAMGARRLRDSIGFPYLKPDKIKQRQDAVAKLLAMDPEAFVQLRGQLKGIADLERLATRVLAKRAQPTELLKIREALERALIIRQNLLTANMADAFSELCEAISKGSLPCYLLQAALSGSPAMLGSSLDVIKEGYDESLDRKRALAKNGESEIEEYENILKQQTGIASLKIKQHKTFGLLIEVTKSNLSKVPAIFIRRQTMVNCERFVTHELQDFSTTLSSAYEETIEREFSLYQTLLEQLSGYIAVFREISTWLAGFDLVQSFAFKARESSYVRPQLSTDGGLTLLASRHPVVEHYVGRNDFVANDLQIHPSQKHLLITGPNMAGKSTIMRQVAISAILHQIGSFLPAQNAVMPIFDRVFTRVGAADDLAKGQSTFMVEMAEAAHILRESTGHSLVILDEVGRGTSTQDGLAIASAIFEELITSIKCYTMFATHYHEMVAMAEKLSSIALLQTQVIENEGKISFAHRIIPGASGSSFGIEVAKIAGIPGRVIEKARVYLAQEPSRTKGSLANKKESSAAECMPLEKFGFAVAESSRSDNAFLTKIAQRLKMVTIHRTTPLQALNILNDLKALSEGASEERGLFGSLEG